MIVQIWLFSFQAVCLKWAKTSHEKIKSKITFVGVLIIGRWLMSMTIIYCAYYHVETACKGMIEQYLKDFFKCILFLGQCLYDGLTVKFKAFFQSISIPFKNCTWMNDSIQRTLIFLIEKLKRVLYLRRALDKSLIAAKKSW